MRVATQLISDHLTVFSFKEINSLFFKNISQFFHLKINKMAKSAGNKPTRLYQKGVIAGYKRARKDLHPNQCLIKIQGVNTVKDLPFYYGKKIAYVYKCKREVQNSRFRVIWGKIRRAHGHNGMARAAFKKNLPPTSFGAPCRIMLYPSNI